jgi:hypothetical protein
MNCPLACKNPDCNVCPFAKESLCDYPFIFEVECQVTEPELF